MENTLELNGAKKCKYCGDYIFFRKSKKGKWYTVDTAVYDGGLVPLTGSRKGMVQFHKCRKSIGK